MGTKVSSYKTYTTNGGPKRTICRFCSWVCRAIDPVSAEKREIKKLPTKFD